MDPRDLASRIDHTLLRPEAGRTEIDHAVAEALRWRFASLCVYPVWIRRVCERLEGSGVRPATVAGFPTGATTPAVKGIELREAVEAGAEEVDVVPWLPPLLEGDVGAVTAELSGLVGVARAARADVTVKAIVETALLLRGVEAEEGERRVRLACRAVRESGCDFVKTSTGFHPAGGASVEAVRLLRRHAGGLAVKAAGGIRSREDALGLLEAGADRLGTSAGATILAGELAGPGARGAE